MSSADTAKIASTRSSTNSDAAPRERILSSALDLFYRHGIHAVGVDAIAEAAATNKMTLYRHFDSKDLLVAECLRRLAAETDAAWEENAGAHAGDPRGQLLGWVRGLGTWKLDLAERGCAFLNTPQSSRTRTIRRDGWSRNSRAVSERGSSRSAARPSSRNPSSSRTRSSSYAKARASACRASAARAQPNGFPKCCSA